MNIIETYLSYDLGDMNRETSFEVYNEYENIWSFISVDLPEPMEAAIPLVMDDVKRIFFIGGRNKQGDTDSISIYDFTFGIDTLHLEVNIIYLSIY